MCEFLHVKNSPRRLSNSVSSAAEVAVVFVAVLVTRHSNKANLFEQQQQEANYSIRMQRSNGSNGDDDCKQLQFKVEVIGAATAPDLSAAQPALSLLSLSPSV